MGKLIQWRELTGRRTNWKFKMEKAGSEQNRRKIWLTRWNRNCPIWTGHGPQANDSVRIWGEKQNKTKPQEKKSEVLLGKKKLSQKKPMQNCNHQTPEFFFKGCSDEGNNSADSRFLTRNHDSSRKWSNTFQMLDGLSFRSQYSSLFFSSKNVCWWVSETIHY